MLKWESKSENVELEAQTWMSGFLNLLSGYYYLFQCSKED